MNIFNPQLAFRLFSAPLLSILVSGCGGGGGGGGATQSSGTNVESRTQVGGSFSLSSDPLFSLNQASFNEKRPDIARIEPNLLAQIYSISGELIATGQAFTDNTYLLSIPSNIVRAKLASPAIISIRRQDSTLAVKKWTDPIVADKRNVHNLNSLTQAKVQALEILIGETLRTSAADFEPRLFALGVHNNYLGSQQADPRGQRIEDLIAGTAKNIDPAAVDSMINRKDAALEQLASLGRALRQQAGLASIHPLYGHELVLRDLLACSANPVVETTCLYPQIQAPVLSNTSGSQGNRILVESLRLNNQSAIVLTSLNQGIILTGSKNIEQTISSLNSQRKPGLNPRTAYILSRFEEIMIDSSFLGKTEGAKHLDGQKFSAQALRITSLLNLPDPLNENSLIPLIQSLNASLLTTEGDISNVTEQLLRNSPSALNNLSRLLLNQILLSEFLADPLPASIQKLGFQSLHQILQKIDASASQPIEIKNQILNVLKASIANQYADLSLPENLFSRPRMVFATDTLSRIQSQKSTGMIHLEFDLLKSDLRIPFGSLKAEFSRSNQNYASAVIQIAGLPSTDLLSSPGRYILSFDSVATIGRTSAGPLYLKLTISDDFSVSKSLILTFQQIGNNSHPELNLVTNPASYVNQLGQTIFSASAPEAIDAEKPNNRTLINLDGTGARDSDEPGILPSMTWTQISGPSVNLNPLSNGKVQFLAPNVIADTTLVFRLDATDSLGGSSSATYPIKILFQNQAPAILAKGPEQTLNIGSIAQLDATSSFDPDGQNISFQWLSTDPTQIPTFAIQDRFSALARYEIPNTAFFRSQNRTVNFLLIVSDNHNPSRSSSTIVSFPVVFVDQAPTANAGPDFSVSENAPSISLNGQASTDLNGQRLRYRWAFVPALSTTAVAPILQLNNPANPDDPANAVVNFTPPNVTAAQGQILLGFELTVTALEEDALGNLTGNTTGTASKDSIVITVLFANDSDPQIQFGANPENQNESLDAVNPNQIFLDARQSCQPDGGVCNPASQASQSLAYFWSQQAGKPVTLVNPNSSFTSFLAPNVRPGPNREIVQFLLAVSNTVQVNGVAQTRTTTAVKTFLISYVNMLPKVDAGPSQNNVPELVNNSNNRTLVFLPSTVTDPDTVDGQTLQYLWTQTGGTGVTLFNSDTPMPSFLAPDVTQDTTLTFQLKIIDGDNLDPQQRPAASAQSDIVTIGIGYVNTAPTLTGSVLEASGSANNDGVVLEGDSFTLQATGNDAETPLTLRYEWLEGPQKVLISNNATVTLASPSDVDRSQGLKTTTYQVRVCDEDLANSRGKGILCNAADINVIRTFKNQTPSPPTFSGPTTLAENNAILPPFGALSTYIASASDPDQDSLFYFWSITSTIDTTLGYIIPQNANPNRNSIDLISTEVCQDTPYLLSLSVEDQDKATSASFSRTVTALYVNRSPVFGGNITNQNDPITRTKVPNQHIQLNVNANDPDNYTNRNCGQKLRFTWRFTPPTVPSLALACFVPALTEFACPVSLADATEYKDPTTGALSSNAFILLKTSTTATFAGNLPIEVEIDDQTGASGATLKKQFNLNSADQFFSKSQLIKQSRPASSLSTSLLIEPAAFPDLIDQTQNTKPQLWLRKSAIVSEDFSIELEEPMEGALNWKGEALVYDKNHIYKIQSKTLKIWKSFQPLAEAVRFYVLNGLILRISQNKIGILDLEGEDKIHLLPQGMYIAGLDIEEVNVLLLNDLGWFQMNKTGNIQSIQSTGLWGEGEFCLFRKDRSFCQGKDKISLRYQRKDGIYGIYTKGTWLKTTYLEEQNKFFLFSETTTQIVNWPEPNMLEFAKPYE